MKGPGPVFEERYRTAREEKIVAMLRLAGFAFEADDSRAEQQVRDALGEWIASGLPFSADAAGGRRFDPVEVIHFLKRRGLEGRDLFWESHYVETGRRLVAEFAAAPGDSVELTLRRTIAVTAPAGKPMRLRAPAPLASVDGPALVVEKAVAEGLDDLRLTVSEGRLEASGLSRGQGEAVMSASYRFPRGWQSVDAPNPRHLGRREGLIVVSEAIEGLARRLAGPSPRPENALRAFWTYMLSEYACGPIHYDQLDLHAPCDFVVRAGWYDCQLGSALFAALCRAVDIPARLIGGYVLYPRAPTNHFWAEAWIGGRGWTPFDLLSWDLSRGGRDADWSDRFFGCIDARMVVERLPLEFTGAIGAKIPAVWRVLQTPADSGVRIDLEGLDGVRVTRDEIGVRLWDGARSPCHRD
ncbi:transglutaminase-like domain-containing protein [Methylocella silvestris]|uniref:Transglutaminase n=1 Tax=Methylocella silvestris TaxID=199596 RepID=A0A2J7TD69_METSI|nr:transglutaminase-like domain-containing protein [Methylocella silvestris]PNG24716.1 transglutaminase [Methylocella silvestris]